MGWEVEAAIKLREWLQTTEKQAKAWALLISPETGDRDIVNAAAMQSELLALQAKLRELQSHPWLRRNE